MHLDMQEEIREEKSEGGDAKLEELGSGFNRADSALRRNCSMLIHCIIRTILNYYISINILYIRLSVFFLGLHFSHVPNM